VIGIEAQDPFERVESIGFAREVDQDLTERDERREVIDIAAN
jgi:hypothetical protein